MCRKIFSSLLALVLCPTSARAEWLEGSSAHFVVYADDNERDLRRFSEQLERYHAALVALTLNETPPPSPSNRITVYIVKNEHEVQRLYGANNKYIGGFYVPRAGGSFAIVPQVNAKTGSASMSMIVLLHEYAHHFMISSSNLTMPRWLSEGSAEFMAASSFKPDGSMMVGLTAQHRGPELFYAPDVKVADLLDPTAYDKRTRRSYDAFYGKSWLLYHFLTFEDARKGQLSRYLTLLAQGKSLHEAGSEAFGDFDKLERDLDSYMRRRLMALELPARILAIGPIAVRKLSAGQAAILPVQIRSRMGVDDAKATTVLAAARAVSARFPGEPSVLAALSEAEFDAGNDKEAIAAADGAIARDPSQANAYVQKGYALFRMAENATDRAAAYRRARATFIALNRLENDHPIPLIFFYRSFVDQGEDPTDLAVNGLIAAVAIAPFDFGLRMTLATRLIGNGRQAEARNVLKPVAYSPHANETTEAARKLIARLDAEPGWRGADIAQVLAPDKETKPPQ
jgi:tetratricopeptide (TPR) repeat protein